MTIQNALEDVRRVVDDPSRDVSIKKTSIASACSSADRMRAGFPSSNTRWAILAKTRPHSGQCVGTVCDHEASAARCISRRRSLKPLRKMVLVGDRRVAAQSLVSSAFRWVRSAVRDEPEAKRATLSFGASGWVCAIPVWKACPCRRERP